MFLTFRQKAYCASGNGVTGGVPFGFDVGVSETPFAKSVIKGMDQGVQGMRVGGVVSVIIILFRGGKACICEALTSVVTFFRFTAKAQSTT